jgi:hypothetical protein
MVYVQGVNADNKPGAVSAAFLDIAQTAGGEVPGIPSATGNGGGGGGGSFGAADLAFLTLGGFALLVVRRRKQQ